MWLKTYYQLFYGKISSNNFIPVICVGMSSMKAVCKCKGYVEDNLVVPIKSGPLDFTKEWGGWTMFGFWVFLLASGGVWFFIVLAWNIQWIFSPPYFCQFCNEKIENSQFR